MSTVRTKAHDQAGAVLTPEQIAERDAVLADHPMPRDAAPGQVPTFMGWNRTNWANAPDPLVDYFGMHEAVDAWRREWDELLVSVGMPPEFDHGELLCRWRLEHERRIEEHKKRRVKQAERATCRLAAGG